jgi:hypothetical protein
MVYQVTRVQSAQPCAVFGAGFGSAAMHPSEVRTTYKAGMAIISDRGKRGILNSPEFPDPLITGTTSRGFDLAATLAWVVKESQ